MVSDCPLLAVLGRITKHRIMELPLHARLDFDWFGSIWRMGNTEFGAQCFRSINPDGEIARFSSLILNCPARTLPARKDPILIRGQVRLGNISQTIIKYNVTHQVNAILLRSFFFFFEIQDFFGRFGFALRFKG